MLTKTDSITKGEKLFRINKSKEKDGVRYWVYKTGAGYYQLFRIEFYPFRREFGIELNLNANSEDTIAFMLKIPFLFAFYLTLDRKFGYSNWWRKFLRLDESRKYDGRVFGITWYNDSEPSLRSGTLYFHLGNYENDWNATDPKWLSFSITPSELLYGNVKYSENILKTEFRDLLIPAYNEYPEKTYKCKCILSERIWTFKRFKKPYKIIGTEIECEEGIPHPGKGTCDYNCQDGALHSITSPIDNIDEALEKFKEQAIWYRKNYPL